MLRCATERTRAAALSVLRCALALRGLLPAVTAPQAMTAIPQLAPWLRRSARARMPRRSIARRRSWWFSANIGQPSTVPPGQTRQLPRDLLAREHGHRSRARGIGAINQPGRLRQQSGQPDKPLRQKAAPPTPALPSRLDALVFLREPVDVLNRLSHPFHTPNQPGLLARPPLRPGFADCLPRVPQPDQRRHRRDPGRHIADRGQDRVHSGHARILPPMATRRSGLTQYAQVMSRIPR